MTKEEKLDVLRKWAAAARRSPATLRLYTTRNAALICAVCQEAIGYLFDCLNSVTSDSELAELVIRTTKTRIRWVKQGAL